MTDTAKDCGGKGDAMDEQNTIANRGAPHRADELHSVEAEEYLISCFLLDAGASLSSFLADGGLAEDFFVAENRILVTRLVALHQCGRPTDLSVLAEALREHGELDTIGGFPYLTQVSGRVPTTAQIRELGGVVRDLADRRELRRILTQTSEQCMRRSGIGTPELVSLLQNELETRIRRTNRGQSRFTVWSPSQVLAYRRNASSVLLGEAILEQGEFTLLDGIGGLGKTRLALSLCICQITGREWCGLDTKGEPQKCLFLSTETGISRYQEDLSKMWAGLTDPERALVEENLRMAVLDGDNEFDLCLGDPVTVDRLKKTLKEGEPGIIVFDPWSDLVDGNEDRNEDVRRTFRSLRKVVRGSAPKASSLIIAHARTGAANIAQAGDAFNAGNFLRGGKALYGSVRAEMQLAPADKDDETRLVLACGKSNNGPKFKTRGLVFDPETYRYEVDPSFDLDAWRANFDGKASSRDSDFTVADAVEIVREIAALPGSEAEFKDIKGRAEAMGCTLPTLKRRLNVAVEYQYLRKGKKRGFYRLGSKPLPKSYVPAA